MNPRLITLKERFAVVTWLRTHARTSGGIIGAKLEIIAKEIECGNHADNQEKKVTS